MRAFAVISIGDLGHENLEGRWTPHVRKEGRWRHNYVIHVHDQAVLGLRSAGGTLTGNPKACMTIMFGTTEAELRLDGGQVVKIILTSSTPEIAHFQVTGAMPS